MIYKFTSKATGDVIMLGPHGDELMRLMGREPAGRGIIEVADMSTALQTLEAAIGAEASAIGKPGTGPQTTAEPAAEDATREPAVALRQRLWPFTEMLRRCMAAGTPVVWGV